MAARRRLSERGVEHARRTGYYTAAYLVAFAVLLWIIGVCLLYLFDPFR